MTDGHPKRDTWTPIRVQTIKKDQGRVLKKADSPWLGSHALIFRADAIDAFLTVLNEFGELLPLASADGDLLLYNPTRLTDALDETRSLVRRFRSGRILAILRHEFRPDALRGLDIFKIPNLKVSPPFVSQRFVDSWNAAGLTGLGFDEVWPAPAPSTPSGATIH